MQLSKALVIQKGQNNTMNPLGFMVRRSMYMYFVYAYGHSGQSGSQAMRNLHGSCGAIYAHKRKKRVRYVEYEVCFFISTSNISGQPPGLPVSYICVLNKYAIISKY